MGRRHVETPWANAGDRGTTPDVATQDVGWQAEEPPFQLFNWLQNLVTETLEHIEQNGIQDWLGITDYTLGALSKGSDSVIYISVQPNTGNDPVADDGSNWVPLIRSATTTVAGITRYATTADVAAGVNGASAVTPFSLNFRVASEILSGLIEIATEAEVLALADAGRAVTPAGLGALAASNVQRGLVQIASHSEVVAGANDTKAVTPLSLAQGTSLGSPGYVTLPGGWIIQVGAVIPPSTVVNVTLPVTYPNDHEAVFVSSALSPQVTWDAGIDIVDESTLQISTAQVGQRHFWMSWGH